MHPFVRINYFPPFRKFNYSNSVFCEDFSKFCLSVRESISLLYFEIMILAAPRASKVIPETMTYVQE